MIIKSPFKDYYDFVAHQFGGGDPRVVYVRNRLKPLYHTAGQAYPDSLVVNTEYLCEDDMRPQEFRYGIDFTKCSWLVICGKRYLLVEENLYDLNSKPQMYSEEKNRKRYIGSLSRAFVDVAKQLRTPVFIVESIGYSRKVGRSHVLVSTEIPILKNTGIASLISPYQMYQDIAYFVGNTLNDNPDITPPASVGEKDRIVGHGFDLKQSFRHRK